MQIPGNYRDSKGKSNNIYKKEMNYMQNEMSSQTNQTSFFKSNEHNSVTCTGTKSLSNILIKSLIEGKIPFLIFSKK